MHAAHKTFKDLRSWLRNGCRLNDDLLMCMRKQIEIATNSVEALLDGRITLRRSAGRSCYMEVCSRRTVPA
jgi:hypothetical protein